MRAKEIVEKVLGDDIPIVLSHEIGTLGLLERENATILNAATIGVMRRTIRALRSALRN